MTRWESPHNLEEVLRKMAKVIGTGAAPMPQGYTAAQIAARGQEIGYPIPEDIRQFYLWFTPERWKTAIGTPIGEHANPYLMPLERASWVYRNREEITEVSAFAEQDLKIPAPNWEESLNFCFAASDMGEEIVYCPNPPEGKPGLIVCWFGTTFPRGVFLGDSLAQWLARFHACDKREYSFALGEIDQSEEEKGDPDCPPGLEEPLRSDFLRDHLRLNPDSESARRLLTQKFWEL